MACPGGPLDATDMEVCGKPREEKSVDYLDLEFWPESDLSFSLPLPLPWGKEGEREEEEMFHHGVHSSHAPPPQGQHAASENGVPMQLFLRPTEEEGMPIIAAVCLLRVLVYPIPQGQNYTCSPGAVNGRLNGQSPCRRSRLSCWAPSRGKGQTWA